MSRPRAVVVLNPAAHGGSARRRFGALRPIVEAAFEARTVIGRPDGAWRAEVRGALDDGVRTFIAAGGDGTAHSLLNALVDAPGRPPLESLLLGAIGLGSSNDLHKPVRHRAQGVPLRLDAAHAEPRDIVRCEYIDDAGSHRACLLVSASVGVAASANARFSSEGSVARCLRRLSTTAAIAWAAARTVAAWRNVPARLAVDGGAAERVSLTSLSVLKSEWLSGWLHFGRSVGPSSGDFDVALVQGIGRAQLLADVLALLRGQFDGRPGHWHGRAQSLAICFDDEMPLELDGEVFAAREARFDMFDERILLCA